MKAVVVLWLALLACIGVAQLPPGGGPTLTISSGSTWPTYFSGTNCNVVAQASWLSPSTDVWKRVRVKIESIAGDTTIYDKTYGEPGGEPMDAVKTVSFRFASTHFADGTALTFRLEAWKNGETTPHVETKTAFAYNKLVSFAIDNTPTTMETVAYEAWTVLDDAHGMYIGDDPGNLFYVTHSNLEAKLRYQTVLFAAVHGGLDQYGDSTYDNSGSDISKLITRLENSAFAYQHRGSLPPMNFAIFYSCITVDSSNNWANSFAVNDTAKAHLGFPALIYWDWDVAPPPNPPKKSLFNHAESLISSLKAGKRVADAVDEANNETQPPFNMAVRGDNYARMYQVYFYPAEYATTTVTQRNTWYWVY